jgi:3-phenylpropionate/cinnamic acid dioxygenase small subunit
MDPADRLELHELPGRYGDAIDDRDWDRLDGIFTDDAVFDLTDLGASRLVGLDEIKRFMDEDADHPRTHTMTNIYVDESADGVKLYFRILALRKGGTTGTASYYDDVVKTSEGWRVAHRVVTLRRRARSDRTADRRSS